MKVNITGVRRAAGETALFDLEEDFPPFEFGSEMISFLSPVHVQLRVHNTGKLLLAQGIVVTELKAVCGRCLEDFRYPLNLSFEDEWVYAPSATEEQQESAFLFEKDEFMINERILEQIVLALPMKFVCTPNCQGLCQQCGANLNREKCRCVTSEVDPRLAGLAKLTLDD